jgi:hypothetical protein
MEAHINDQFDHFEHSSKKTTLQGQVGVFLWGL